MCIAVLDGRSVSMPEMNGNGGEAMSNEFDESVDMEELLKLAEEKKYRQLKVAQIGRASCRERVFRAV